MSEFIPSAIPAEEYIDLYLKSHGLDAQYRKFTKKHPLKGMELVAKLRQARRILEMQEIFAHLRKAGIK